MPIFFQYNQTAFENNNFIHVSPMAIVYSFAVCLNQSKEMLSTFKTIHTVNILQFAV